MAEQNQTKPKFRTSIGGQALIEGILMRGPEKQAIVVRSKEGLVEKVEELKLIRDRYPILGLPVLRGAVTFVDSMVRGVKALMYSADFFPEEEGEPSKLDLWLEKKLGSEKLQKLVVALAVVLSLGLTIGLFMILPTFLAGLLGRFIPNVVVHNLVESVIKLLIFFGYLLLCSKQKDIQRVFQYHGAEHKTVYCNEAGLELTPENARQFSRLHPRCGTAFLFLVMFISILIGAVADQVLFALFGIEKLTFLGRILRSLLTLPIVTGVSYEVLKGLAHAGDSVIVRILRWPGMMLQYLTTREPDDSMLEVAIASMKAAKAGPAHYGENLDANVYVYGAKGKKPEPAGDGQANENAPDEARKDEKEVEKEDEKNDEKKDGASA